MDFIVQASTNKFKSGYSEIMSGPDMKAINPKTNKWWRKITKTKGKINKKMMLKDMEKLYASARK